MGSLTLKRVIEKTLDGSVLLLKAAVCAALACLLAACGAVGANSSGSNNPPPQPGPPPTITTSALPDGTEGDGYSTTLSGTGGVMPYGWSIVAGQLPPGLTLDAGGIISGTPAVSGDFAVTIQVRDSSPTQQSANKALPLRIRPRALRVATNSLPSGTVGMNYSAALAATGGTRPYIWSLASGTLPPGLTLASAGGISGTPSQSGSFTFTVRVTDSFSPAQTDIRALSLSVAPAPPLSIATSSLPSGQVGVVYNATLAATGGTTPYSWSLSSGALPAGLTLSSAGGISGTPSQSGSFSFTVRVTDSSSPALSANKALNITIGSAPPPPLSISTSSLASGTVGVGYSATLAATGGTTPYSWSLAAGALPPGLVLSSAGVISGTPTSAGNYTTTVRVTDSGSPAQTATRTLAISIAPPPLAITTSSLPSGTVGAVYNATLTATGGTPAYTWSIASGVLPAGVILAATSGQITGTPTTPGSFGVTFRVTDNGSTPQTISQSFTISIAAPNLTITTNSLPPGTIGQAYNAALSATGGTPPYTWVLTAGILPAGLSLNAAGTISGTPTAAGLATFTAQVTDSLAQTNERVLTISVASAAAVVAFPGAEGGGALSVGGRGGTVHLVTTTADSGPGSLRACIDAVGPRTCVFRTGGTISLLSQLTVSNPFLTIAGQTAAGGGIQIRGPSGPNAPGNHSLLIRTHNVVIQYLRVRRGHNAGEICNQAPWSCGASVVIRTDSSANPHSIVLDHVSMMWSNYDAIIILGSNATINQPRSITISRSIMGEALAGAGQVVAANFSGFSGQGPAAPDGMIDIDVHHSLFAGTSHRMPLMTVRSGRLVNNYVYAWTYYAMHHKGLRDFIGNYFAMRAGQTAPTHEIGAWTENAGNDTSLAPSFFVTGNAGPSDPNGTSNWTMTALAANQSSGPETASPLSPAFQRGSPIPRPAGYIPITTDPVGTIASASGPILNVARTAPYDAAGASRKLTCNGDWEDALDPVDSRILNAVANRTTLFGSYTYMSLATSPQSQADLGGWPTLAAGVACTDANTNGLPDVWEAHWASVFGLGSILNPAGLDFGDGYTNLEHYIYAMNPSP